MKQGSIRVFLGLALLLLMGRAAAGQEYQRPKPSADGGPPTKSDLALYDGAAHSLTVQLLNLTPYDIQFVRNPGVTWSITSANEAAMQDTNATRKSFMFVPAGVPSLIPGAPAKNFADPYLPDGTTPNPDYDPDYVDEITHPYSIVFSWDDHGGFVADNWIKFTVKGVKYGEDREVPLGLWMYRNKPTFKLSSSLLPVIVSSLKAVFYTVSLPIRAESPLAWAHEFLALTELAKTAEEFAKENSQDNDGEKMWIASYVIPHPTSNCIRAQAQGQDCDPAQITQETGDGVYSQWTGSIAGPCTTDAGGGLHCSNQAAESELVMSVHLLRGQRAKQCDPFYYPKTCPLGSEPVVMITVMRPEEFVVGALAGGAQNLTSGDQIPRNTVRLFLLQAGAGRIQELLEKKGRLGHVVLRSLIRSLDAAQQQVLREMILTMGSGRLPTQQERQLVRLLADDLKTRLK